MRVFRLLSAPLLFLGLCGFAASSSVEDSSRLEASGQLAIHVPDGLGTEHDDDLLSISPGESCEDAIASLGNSEGVCFGDEVLSESLEGDASEMRTDYRSDFDLAAASDCVPYSTSNKVSDYIVVRADSFIYVVNGQPKSCGGVSVRTVLGDRTPNYRIKFEWEHGTAITFKDYVYRVRKSDAFADTIMDPPNDFQDFTVGSSNPRAWVPSSTGTRSSGTYLTGDTTVKYHEDFGLGTINTAGKAFAAKVMHTGRWNRCSSSTGCKYYQVPWKTSP